MLALRENKQPGHPHVPQFVLRQHPANCMLDHFAGILRNQIAELRFLQPARPPRVPSVHFLLELAPAHFHMLRIDHNHIIAAIARLVEYRLVLAHQHRRDLRAHTAQDLALRIDKMPHPRCGSVFLRSKGENGKYENRWAGMLTFPIAVDIVFF
ncbi:hypothetical protein AYI69_g5246 [Smittium culicis]|uniref:Uncharacterized protein n=1 Tax=Smittium culicis TaxID=133412 RepID=A0A1R1Y798_9FUNG|nr:hypothetical protein AYI69_g5246 [Smittium culicis]